jgi:D-alanine-D-alanine ligase
MAEGRTKVIVIYGGQSTEHEISLKSAAFVFKNLDRNKYDVSAIAIDKAGRWLPQNISYLMENMTTSVPIEDRPGRTPLLPLPMEPTPAQITSRVAMTQVGYQNEPQRIVVFPVLHGSYGEDGSIQGLFNLGSLAFVGSGTLGSALGMDKCIAKRLVQGEGIAVVPWVEMRSDEFSKSPKPLLARAEQELGYPMFVKPASLGSSVGVSKVRNFEELSAACVDAFRYDEKVLVEKGLDVREIELAALGDHDPMISEAGEVVTHGASFYSYEAKYLSKTQASSEIPANLSPAQKAQAKDYAKRIFQCLECHGLARIDLFLERGTDKFYFNEINTLPGLTEISQYPLLWAHSGIPPKELLDRLIELALKRHDRAAKLVRNH